MGQPGRQPLSAADGAWWRMEHPTNPMTITAVFTFAAPLPFAALAELLAEKLVARHRRFRQRVVDGGGTGGAYWEDDPGFALEAHLVATELPPGAGHEALQTLVSELMSTPLPPDRAPWQFHVIERYQGATALVARVHHAMGDGLSLVQVLLQLADPPAPGEEEATAADPAVDAGGSRRRRGRGAMAQLGAVVSPGRVLAGARVGGGFAATVARLLDLRADARTPLRGALGVEKRAAWSQPIPLDLIKRIGQGVGGTLNDVLLSAVAGAIRLYLHGRGHAPDDGLTVHAVVPVNLRRADDLDSLGNKFGMVFLPLPVGEPHPIARLRATKRAMDRLKRSPEAVVIFGILRALGRTTATAIETAVNLLGRKATAVMTNVPGPRALVRFRGVAIADMMFWVPQSGKLGLGVSILSYAGQVRIGVASDAGLVPDPQAIVRAFHAALEELLAHAPLAAGGHAPPSTADRIAAARAIAQHPS